MRDECKRLADLSFTAALMGGALGGFIDGIIFSTKYPEMISDTPFLNFILSFILLTILLMPWFVFALALPVYIYRIRKLSKECPELSS